MTSVKQLSESCSSPRDYNRILQKEVQFAVNELDVEEAENIPYHARQHARPFTYGNVPAGFKTSELNHVVIEDEVPESPKPIRVATVFPASSPSMLRKSTRPSISPSRPVLRKTPSRQEFEEMLIERREQAMREQNNNATKLAQNASIQEDLDELQEILNKKGIQTEQIQTSPAHKSIDKVRQLEASDPSVVATCSDCNELNATTKNNKYEPTLLLAETKRPETPLFPVGSTPPIDGRCISPYPTMAIDSRNQQLIGETPGISESVEHIKNLSDQHLKYGDNTVTNDPHEVEPHLVKFAKDCSEFWYKPHLTREESVALLRNATPGRFIVRSSTTYKNAYGLVLRVAKPPPGVFVSENSNGDELVRHFLLEPTTRGVRLKGCTNEPVFTSLSALVYQHSINQLALPCKLLIPDRDIVNEVCNPNLMNGQRQLLAQGAACNVLYLFTCNMESLTGDEAIRKAVHELYAQRKLSHTIEVHLKVSNQGVTLTDNTRRIFFRRHYASHNISHFGIDPDNRFWSVVASDEGLERSVKKTIFGFVERPLVGTKDNQCHVFCDLAASQPAAAIVSFANKVLPMGKQNLTML